MSAFRFHADADGYICGGFALVGTLSSETWRVPEACPVRSPEECGFTIAWPNGERWTHDHIAQAFPALPDDTKEAA